MLGSGCAKNTKDKDANKQAGDKRARDSNISKDEADERQRLAALGTPAGIDFPHSHVADDDRWNTSQDGSADNIAAYPQNERNNGLVVRLWLGNQNWLLRVDWLSIACLSIGRLPIA